MVVPLAASRHSRVTSVSTSAHRDGRAARPPPPPRLKAPPKISPKPPLSPCPDARPPKMSERSKSSCVDRNPPGKPAPPDLPNPPERTILRKLSYSLRSRSEERRVGKECRLQTTQDSAKERGALKRG